MEKYRITIRGPKVHNVGYRVFLLAEAEVKAISNFSARNLKTDTEVVEVLVGGNKDKVDAFIKFARENFPENASVERVTVEKYEGDVTPIESFSRAFSISQLSKIARSGVALLDVTTKGFKTLSDKQDLMLEKQDKTIEVIREESERTREELSGVIREESEKTRQTVREESERTREELSGVIREESEKTRQTVREESEKTREELSGVIREESEKTRQTVREESEKTREELTSKLDEGFTGLKEEHIKTRELSKEIFYSEVREVRQELRDLRLVVEEIRKKVGII
jgi:acylphosphatase